MSNTNPYESKGTAGEGESAPRAEDDAVVQLSRQFAQQSVEYDANYGHTAAEAATAEAGANQAAFEAAKAIESPSGADYASETPEEAATTLPDAFERYSGGSGVDYGTLLKDDLVTEADKRGVDSSGTKAKIVTRLTEADEAERAQSR